MTCPWCGCEVFTKHAMWCERPVFPDRPPPDAPKEMVETDNWAPFQRDIPEWSPSGFSVGCVTWRCRSASLPRRFWPGCSLWLNWLITNKIVIITFYPQPQFSKNICRINGDNLKDYQFYKVIDPFTLFQEISMWIGGILPHQGRPMVDITDDKIKIVKHGFDKFSFRKEKENS